MKKRFLLLCAALLSSCGDDLGWDKDVKIHDALCYDSSTAEVSNEGDTQGDAEDITPADSGGSSDDSWDNDTDSAGDVSDIPNIEGDVTEAVDIESDTGSGEDAIPPPECVTATDCKADENPCTDSSCDAGKCVQLPNSGTCTDGDACTGEDACQLDKCAPGLTISCDDLNPCTDDSCDPAKGCVNLPNQATCSDNDKCTDSDTCDSGVCIPGKPINCDDLNPCTDDSCDNVLGCVNLPNTTTCTDSNACTLNDVCSNAICAGFPAVCDDSQVCTDDFCDPLIGCVNLPNASTCTDDDDCTLLDVCSDGKCKSGEMMLCPSSECIISSCEKGACVDDKTMLNDVKCDDGKICTELAKCLDGKCLTANSKNCDDANSCTLDSCDASTGACAHTPAGAVPCDDGSKCSLNDTCENGVCKSGPNDLCPDGNPCTVDGCSIIDGCFHDNAKDGTLCGDGLCSAGKCICVSGFGCASPKFTYTNDTNAGMLGGMGGGVGPKMGCDDTDILIGIGFDFSTGTKTATRTTVVCGKVSVAADGTVSTVKTTTQKSGGSGCYGWDPSVATPLVECDSGWGVVGIKGKKPGGTLFNSVSIVCGKLNINGKPTGETNEVTVPGMPGTGADQSVSCPEGSIARFFETRAGCGQDALTMYCATPAPDCTDQPLICKDTL